MAVDDLNARGGVLGAKVALTVADDACDPKQAVAVAQNLAEQKVAFVAGHFCSGSSIPASQIYNNSRILQISPASSNPRYTDQRPGAYIYRIAERDDQQGAYAGFYLAAEFNDKNIAIVHDKTIYGKGIADEVKRALNTAGKREAIYEGITAGERDYAALVGKLQAAKVDVLYYGGYHIEAALIVRQMRERGMKARLVAADALVTNEFWQIAGAAGEGTWMTFQPDQRRNPAAADVVRRFRAQKIEPEGYMLYAYAAVQTWAQAVRRAGALEPVRIVGALNELQFDTVVGSFRFDKKGDTTLPSHVFYEWRGGRYEQVN